MSDTLRPEPGSLPDVPYDREPWEEEWINQGGNTLHSREMRLRGSDVLHRIQEGLPLSPREAAMAKYVNDNPAWKDYREFGMSEDTIARIMIDNIGSILVNPEGQIDELARIVALSDKRPPEATT